MITRLARLSTDVAGVSIRGMVIVFDALGARNELGTKVPETAEPRSSLFFINRPYGRPDVFYTLFYHACYSHGIREVRLLGTLYLTAIYRSFFFGDFNLYSITAVYRSGVFAFLTRDPCPNRDLQECFIFALLSTTVEVLTSCLIYEWSRDI